MKLFRAPNTTAIWRIDKVFGPTHAGQAKKLAPNERYIHLRVYFSIEEDEHTSARQLLGPLLDGYYRVQGSPSIEDYEQYVGGLVWDDDANEAFEGVFAEPVKLRSTSPIEHDDVHRSLWVPGAHFIRYLERANVYVFAEYLCHTPSTLGIIQELEAFKAGIRYTNAADAWALAKLLKAAAEFWH